MCTRTAISTGDTLTEKLASEPVVCGCCGCIIPDDEHHNADYGIEPYPNDMGIGTCMVCAQEAIDAFYESRTGYLMLTLDPVSRKMFEGLSRSRKRTLIDRLVDKGMII